MRISAIIPLYNTRAYINAAVDSILAQTRPADEIIVVDDGSTDGGPELLGRYGPAVRLLRQGHQGSAAALNRGIAAANGDVIAFLDADDLWVEDKLARQAPVLIADPALDGVFGHVRQFRDEAGRDSAPAEPQRGVSRISLLVRRAAFDRFGRFDETLRSVDFVPWYSRAIALGFTTAMLPEVVAHRRLHAANTGRARRNDQQQENLIGLKRALDIRRRRAAGPDPAPRDQD